MDEASVDAIVCDPPYEIGFMSKRWDSRGVAFDPATWTAALRVLKPGGHLVAFGGARTHHRLWCAVEDAGFEIRDTILCCGLLAWTFGSGFPKGLDVSKAIDKAAGAERERVLAYRSSVVGQCYAHDEWTKENRGVRIVDEPLTPDAEQWQGWNVALKPAYEPILLARKPLSEANVAANVLRHGTGGINVDACRVAPTGESLGGGRISTTTEGWDRPWKHDETAREKCQRRGDAAVAKAEHLGRWPTNFLLVHSPWCVRDGERRVDKSGHYPKARGAGGIGNAGHSGQSDLVERSLNGETVAAWNCTPDCAVRMLDQQGGDERGAFAPVRGTEPSKPGYHGGFSRGGGVFYADSGGASRFFPQFAYEPADFAPFLYSAKASRRERGEGNTHATVKPVAVIRWLMRLVTPKGGVVLDPFVGSGTGAIAADREGFDFVGVEEDAEHVAIAKARHQQDAPLFNREAAVT